MKLKLDTGVDSVQFSLLTPIHNKNNLKGLYIVRLIILIIILSLLL